MAVYLSKMTATMVGPRQNLMVCPLITNKHIIILNKNKNFTLFGERLCRICGI